MHVQLVILAFDQLINQLANCHERGALFIWSPELVGAVWAGLLRVLQAAVADLFKIVGEVICFSAFECGIFKKEERERGYFTLSLSLFQTDFVHNFFVVPGSICVFKSSLSFQRRPVACVGYLKPGHLEKARIPPGPQTGQAVLEGSAITRIL